MPQIAGGAFGVAAAGTTPPIYPTGGVGNTYQAAGFIPEIWSGKLIEKFYDSTVLTAISNTDYEGEIKNQGDRIKIRIKPTIQIKKYLADGRLDLDRPVGSSIEMFIDKGWYFNLIEDDVMKVQSDINMMSMWADDASEQLKIKVDTDVLTGIMGKFNARNMGSTAGRISQNINLGATGTPLDLVAKDATAGQVEILEAILRLGLVLDEQNIPETGRWIVMPSWAAQLLKASPLQQAYMTGDSVSPLRNGKLGMIDRFTLYSGNLLPSGTAAGLAAGETVIYAGHAHGLTFASQVTNMETLRSEMTFGTILRGLQVYGYQVVDDVALAQAVVTH